jgi:hypothetical protein
MVMATSRTKTAISMEPATVMQSNSGREAALRRDECQQECSKKSAAPICAGRGGPMDRLPSYCLSVREVDMKTKVPGSFL